MDKMDTDKNTLGDSTIGQIYYFKCGQLQWGEGIGSTGETTSGKHNNFDRNKIEVGSSIAVVFIRCDSQSQNIVVLSNLKEHNLFYSLIL